MIIVHPWRADFCHRTRRGDSCRPHLGERIATPVCALVRNDILCEMLQKVYLKFVWDGFGHAGAAGFTQTTGHMGIRLLGKLGTADNILPEFIPERIHRFIQA